MQPSSSASFFHPTVLPKTKMKNPLSSSDDDDDESLKLLCYWWRSDSMFDECMNFSNISSLVPRVRVLREYERLALIVSEGLNELRHKLLAYRSGGDFWVPVGGLSKEDMDIPPVVTFLLVGFSGSGKSSLVNLMYSVLGRSGILPFAQTSTGDSSKFTTMYLEEHNVLRSMKNGFCVYDSRGFRYDNVDEMHNEISQWMTEGIHHHQLCLRSGDKLFTEDEMEDSVLRSSSMFVTRKVNCVMVVANIAEIYEALKLGDFTPLESTRQLFSSPALRKCNENPILILTHGDLLSTKDRIDGRLKICESLGISESSGVYDIVCLTEYGYVAEESDRIIAYALCESVYRGLLISDRNYVPKRKLQDWAVLVLTGLMLFMAGLFSLLARLCSKFGHRNKLKL